MPPDFWPTLEATPVHREIPAIPEPVQSIVPGDAGNYLQGTEHEMYLPGEKRTANLLFLFDWSPKGQGFPSDPKSELLLRMIQAMKLESKNLSYGISCLIHPDRPTDLWKKEVLLLGTTTVIPLGATSTKQALGREERLSLVHGKYFDQEITWSENNTSLPSRKVSIVPLFHPEYLLINPKMKMTAWQDMKKIMHTLGISTE